MSSAVDDPIVLVAHGSRDPRAARTTEVLARAVAAGQPGAEVRAAYLDHTPPAPNVVLRALAAAGHRGAVLVPLLLTAAYHRRVDLPGAVAAARAEGLRMSVRIADVLGPTDGPVDPLLLAALRRRLAEAVRGSSGIDGTAPDGIAPDGTAFDSVVLAAAGTRDPRARDSVAAVATALGAALDVPCLPAYVSAASPTPAEAVRGLRAKGLRRVAVAAYFIAPGRLYEAAAASTRAAGAVAVAAPLADAPEIVRLIQRRTAGAPGTASRGAG